MVSRGQPYFERGTFRSSLRDFTRGSVKTQISIRVVGNASAERRLPGASLKVSDPRNS